MNTKLDKIKPAIKPGTHSDINSPFNFSEVNKILSLLLKMQTMTKSQIINYQIKKLNFHLLNIH